jgi:DNA-binding GntR family transcriptional regulator
MFYKHWNDLYSPREIGERHMRIVTSLMSGDPAEIERTVRDHYSESGSKIAAIYKANGQLDED